MALSSRYLRAGVAVLGAALVAVALVIIWVARSEMDRVVYVSGLGADGEPTAARFELALLLIVGGGLMVAWGARGVRSRLPYLNAWAPSATLVVSCLLFFVASQVPCTYGCPVPVGDTFTWQDLIHTSSAVLAFGAAAWAMLQTAFAEGYPRLRRISLAAAILVAVIAAAGGIMSLLQFRIDVGSLFEFIATSIGIFWLSLLGVATARTAVMPSAAATTPS